MSYLISYGLGDRNGRKRHVDSTILVALISGLIAFLTILLGGRDAQEEEVEPEQVPAHVQTVCESAPQECPPGSDAGRVHAVDPYGVLPPAAGDQAPQREDILR